MCTDVCTDVPPHKSKRQKLVDISSSPIKTTQLEPDSSGFQYEQSSHSPLPSVEIKRSDRCNGDVGRTNSKYSF